MSAEIKARNVVYQAEYDPDTGYAGVRFVPMMVCDVRACDGLVVEALCEMADGRRAWLSCHGVRPPRLARRDAVADLLELWRRDVRDTESRLEELREDVEALEAALEEESANGR
jgi:hypothetical protein